MSRRKGRSRKVVVPTVDSSLSLLLSICNSTKRKRTPINSKQLLQAIDLTISENQQTDIRISSGSTERVISNTLEEPKMLDNVTKKINSFWKCGDLVSSDDEETPTPKGISNINCRLESPTTSSNAHITKKKDDDDIMAIVDSVLSTNVSTPDVTTNNIKSLEDYMKETEEILQNTNTLLSNFKEEGKDETGSNDQKSDAPCPICMESLADRPASVTVCGHIFCTDCIQKTVCTTKKCPTCRKCINKKQVHVIYL